VKPAGTEMAGKPVFAESAALLPACMGAPPPRAPPAEGATASSAIGGRNCGSSSLAVVAGGAANSGSFHSESGYDAAGSSARADAAAIMVAPIRAVSRARVDGWSACAESMLHRSA